MKYALLQGRDGLSEPGRLAVKLSIQASYLGSLGVATGLQTGHAGETCGAAIVWAQLLPQDAHVAFVKGRGSDFLGVQWASQVKNMSANAGDIGDTGLICGLGRSPGGRLQNPLQYSCLENPMDRGAWRATVHRVAKSWTRLK